MVKTPFIARQFPAFFAPEDTNGSLTDYFVGAGHSLDLFPMPSAATWQPTDKAAFHADMMKLLLDCNAVLAEIGAEQLYVVGKTEADQAPLSINGETTHSFAKTG